jgi:hypothetical protein
MRVGKAAGTTKIGTVSVAWARVVVVAGAMLAGAGARGAEAWLLRDGQEYYGTAVGYDFRSREVTLRKVDGKEFSFPARELAFAGKMRLMDSPAFGEALRDYRPPIVPTAVALLAVVAAGCLPTLIGLWSSAHLFGTAVPARTHVLGFLKVLLVLVAQGGVWLVAALFLDAGRPLLPDTNADIVMTLTVLVVGLLAASLVVAFHYHRSFWKGMAITCLAGVFAGIVAVAMALGTLYAATRMDAETLVTRTILEPFALF